jgi:acyl-CoA reductase-like NAD-dependent aldehyde dehydrogenase
MPEKFLISDKFVTTEKTRKITNPYTGKVTGEICLADEKHFDESADYLTARFEEYRKLPVYKRQEILYNISQKLEEEKNSLAGIITDETGKPIKFSLIEVERAILTFRLGAEECSRIEGEVLSLDLLRGSEGKTGIVKRFPVGLILGITPWNFPVNLVAHKISPALASGNVIMIKPASNAVLSCLALGRIIYDVFRKAGIDYMPLNVLPLSGADMDTHISDSRIKLISFTGSSSVGWGIKKKADRQKVSLELGGNAGVIVCEDAELSSAAAKIVMGGFAQAGQSCISVQRVYIHESVYDKMKNVLIEESQKIKFGDPYNKDTITGPMITEDEAKRAEGWIREAESAGAKILIGGKRNGAVLEPTIIEDAPDSTNVKCGEVFAPVITIEKYSNFEDAVRMVNDSKYGLQAGVFTYDMRKIMYAYNNIETGGVIINEASAYRMDAMPYGGVKDSGNTREGVKYAIREMTEEKILVM